MTTETKAPVKERRKLTITEVSEPTSFGDRGGIKLAFKDATLSYITFNKRLFPLIKVGETIDADIETATKEYPSGASFTDRKITEIYVEGKPVGGQRQGGGGGQFRQRDPEQIASIEAQVSFKGIVELIVAQVVKTTDPVGKAAINWALARLDGQKLEPAFATGTGGGMPAGGGMHQGGGGISVGLAPEATTFTSEKSMAEASKETGKGRPPMRTLEQVVAVEKDAHKVLDEGLATSEELKAMLVMLGAKGATLNSAIKSLDDAGLLTFGQNIKDILENSKELLEEDIPF